MEEGAARAPLLFVEGQGALGHPAYSGVTLGLLHGWQPDVLVLCHRAGATEIDDYPGAPIPPLRELVETYERAAALGAARRGCAAIALNTRGLDDGAATAAIARREPTRPACRPTTRCASAARRCSTAVV